jgi:hypothetical protein
VLRRSSGAYNTNNRCAGWHSDFSSIHPIHPTNQPTKLNQHLNQPFQPLPSGLAVRAKLNSAKLTNRLLIQQTGILKDRFDLALKQKVGKFTGAQKKRTIREMIGPTST